MQIATFRTGRRIIIWVAALLNSAFGYNFDVLVDYGVWFSVHLVQARPECSPAVLHAGLNVCEALLDAAS